MLPLDNYFSHSPFLAILRGVEPDEVLKVADCLIAQEIRAIEVPLNSPQALKSISQLVAAYGEEVLIGAGTVLSAEQVRHVADVGGKIIVSPNFAEPVVRESIGLGLYSVPGVFTPSEAFAAIDAGASALKMFPADTLGPKTVASWKAVLPKDFPLIATGGISPANVAEWLEAGCFALGTGSVLYKPGIALDKLEEAACAYLAAFRNSQTKKATIL